MADSFPPRLIILEPEGTPSEHSLSSAIRALGLPVLATFHLAEDLLTALPEFQPEILIADMDLPGPIDAIQIADLARQQLDLGVVFIASQNTPDATARVRHTHPHGFLMRPHTHDELRITLELAISRYRDEKNRRREEQSYLEAFQSLTDGVIVTDLAGLVVFINQAAETITGWLAAEASGHSLHEIFRIFDSTGNPADLEAAEQHQPTAERTVWLTQRSGKRIPIQDRSAALRDQNQALTGMIILFRHTPQAQHTPAPCPQQKEPTPETPLIDSPFHLISPTEAPPEAGTAPAATYFSPNQTAPLVDVVESISDPLLALDGNWRLTFANAAASRLLERATPDLLGADFWSFLHPNARQSHFQTLAHAMFHRQAVSCELYDEHRQRWLELHGYPFAEGLLLLAKDVTERRQDEERKNRMDRLESLGLLARGFAHDFNNLLTVLLGNLSLAEMRMDNKDPIAELQVAKQATLQAQSLVQQLLTFARGGAPIKRQTSLATLLTAFLEHHPKVRSITYHTDIQPDLPPASIDPAQIRRVLSNLVRNAEQAQPDGGIIRIRIYAPEPQELYPEEPADPHATTAISHLVIEVRDGGEGIPPEHLNHIFEPYFSTKKAENATGLGLTVCESIAKAHNGSVTVRSLPSEGTTVRFYLPVDSDADESSPYSSPEQDSQSTESQPRILLLEDDPLISSLISRNLSSNGFQVTTTPEGSETIRHYQEAMRQGQKYDLVILDLSIPNGMGGVRTMEKLRSLDPDVVAIVSSGYSDDPVMAKPAAYGFTGVLPKPYEPADLLRLVRNILAASRLKQV